VSASHVQFYPGPHVSNPADALPFSASRLSLLRLSVTDRCNFRCRYCMPVEGVVKVAHRDILPLESMVELVQWLVEHTGINRVRLTGGEPLVRSGIEQLVSDLSKIARIREVSLTTNGSLLPRMAWGLKVAGLSRVNISLDSLDEERFAEVTRGGHLQPTLNGIAAAQEAGLTPIKLNTVLRRSTWKQEVPALLDYAAQTGFEIRFIELMRTGTERAWCETEFVSVDEVCAGLGADIYPVEEASRASARKTTMNWHGSLIAVGWITPRSHPFCSRCDRLRMDAQGRLRRCLMDPTQLDLVNLLRWTNGDMVKHEFDSYIAGKVPPITMDNVLAMSQIGG
jgi:cyclic pyranopterin phosphate synthase